MRRTIHMLLLLGVLAKVPALAQNCSCGAPCDLLLESDISAAESVTACNTITVIGATILPGGIADLEAGVSVSFFDGFAVHAGGVLTVALDALLSCDPMIDADLDGFDQCLDCDEADENNWLSCSSCIDGDGDSAWTNCDAYVSLSGPDCDDNDSNRKPGVTETCNATDDNCNGLVDECLNCSGSGVIEADACPACAGMARAGVSP